MNKNITVEVNMAAVAVQPDEKELKFLAEGVQNCSEMVIPETFVKDVQLMNETPNMEVEHTQDASRERNVTRSSRNVGMDR